mmetsp:Transcript_18217/g.24002  ORF Transcript_18217/g.24002 Transcript_18217/m.24002 type:complete len:304 (+) Transcript_18217:84-995(+)
MDSCQVLPDHILAYTWLSILTISIFYICFATGSTNINGKQERKTIRGDDNNINIFEAGMINPQMNHRPDAHKVPRHVAVIMDGNRRYGKIKYGNVYQGHKDGADTLVDFMGWCMDLGIQVLTVYAFSTENWNRNEKEIEMLMGLITTYIDDVKKEAREKNIRIRVISSDFERLPNQVKECVRQAEAETADCTAFHINICLSYGARHDLVQACQKLASKVESGQLTAAHIDETLFRKELSSSHIQNDPDLLIRTSGEFRISNYLLFEIAYSELIFVDKFWPQIKKHDLIEIINEYSTRNRRYGR